MLSEVLKPVGTLIIIIVAEFLILFFNLNNIYERNAFKVSINNQELYVYYSEQYRSVIFPFLLDARNSIHSPNAVTPVINKVEYSENMELDLKEFEVYHKKSNTRDSVEGWYFSSKYNYKETRMQDVKLIIKRKGNILYDGDYIKNISSYIVEPGRYFFQVKTRRKINFYTTVKTHMNFNVIVDGDKYE